MPCDDDFAGVYVDSVCSSVAEAMFWSTQVLGATTAVLVAALSLVTLRRFAALRGARPGRREGLPLVALVGLLGAVLWFLTAE